MGGTLKENEMAEIIYQSAIYGFISLFIFMLVIALGWMIICFVELKLVGSKSMAFWCFRLSVSASFIIFVVMALMLASS